MTTSEPTSGTFAGPKSTSVRQLAPRTHEDRCASDDHAFLLVGGATQADIYECRHCGKTEVD